MLAIIWAEKKLKILFHHIAFLITISNLLFRLFQLQARLSGSLRACPFDLEKP